jgi:hypothetical protein
MGFSRGTDPGWWAAVRRKDPNLSGLTAIRSIYLALLLAGLVIGVVLIMIVPLEFDPAPLPIIVIVAMGITSQLMRVMMTNKAFTQETVSSGDALATAWRSDFFLGYALTDSTLLIGFVFCFVEDAIWPYVLALPFFLYGMASIAPTRANLQRLQDRVTAQGSVTSVMETLNRPMPSPTKP